MFFRCFTALVGGYVSASALASLAARIMPVSRVEATVWAMLLAFLLFAIAGLWAFHEACLRTVAAAIWGSAIASIALTVMLGTRP
jgi:hypothetical protein